MQSGLINLASSFIRKNSTQILTAVECFGVIGTAVMTAIQTPKAISAIKKKEKEKGEKLTKWETIKAAAPKYIAPAVMATATISCAIGSNVISIKQKTALIGAYTMLNTTFQKYKAAAKEVYGNDADKKIMEEVAPKPKGDFAVGEGKIREGDIEILFYDEYKHNYFNAYAADIVNAAYALNRQFILEGEVTLNDWYEFLGQDGIGDQGDNIGWNLNKFMDGGVMWIETDYVFTHPDDGMDCYIVNFVYPPDILDF
jgi:hypothetical protein